MKKCKKKNKTMAILQHLEEKGHINSWEAIKEYGATRLSAIIFNLRHKYDLHIINERVEFVDRYGTKSHYDNYILIKDREFCDDIYEDY